jgi:hypothetical protein
MLKFALSHNALAQWRKVIASSSLEPYLNVPDRRCRIQLEVVFVRRWVIGVLGIWRGEGFGERFRTREVSL